MHYHKMFMYINFQLNRLNGSVITMHTIIFAKNRKLHKFATTNSIFLNLLFQTCIIVKRTCISIFSKKGFADQSKVFTQIYLQKIVSCINLQLPIIILKKIDCFRHA